MYDSWVDAADKGKTVGVALCDMSAAFDVVDTELLLKTCKQFGFEREAVQWIWSFLTEQYTSEAVCPQHFHLRWVFHKVQSWVASM